MIRYRKPGSRRMASMGRLRGKAMARNDMTHLRLLSVRPIPYGYGGGNEQKRGVVTSHMRIEPISPPRAQPATIWRTSGESILSSPAVEEQCRTPPLKRVAEPTMRPPGAG
jgi:hypothetical protein